MRKFVYEFFGSSILSYALNAGSSSGYGAALFLVSVLAWEVSDAHFNFGITLAEFVMNVIKNSDELVEQLISLGLIAFAQISGAFLGNAFSQASTIKLGTEDQWPKSSVQCPKESYSYF